MNATFKKTGLVVGVLAVLAAGVAVDLSWSTPRASRLIRFPLSNDDRALLAAVPADASAFAWIPSLGSFETALRANPVTAHQLEAFAEHQPLPPSWVVGDGDLLVWREKKQNTYYLRLDPLRRMFARAYVAWSSDGEILLDPPQAQAISAADLSGIEALAGALPPAEALVVQREEDARGFPPINRPAVTAIEIGAKTIDLISRSAAGDDAQPALPPLQARLSRSALLSAAFGTPTKLLDEMNRIIGAKTSVFLDAGGSMVIYDVNAGTLLPRPREVLVVAATPEHRASVQHLTSDALRQWTEAAGFRVQTAESDGALLVAFDDTSIPAYQHDVFDSSELVGNRWIVRIDPARAAPILDHLSGSAGLRYLAPHLFRTSRSVSSWIDRLSGAQWVDGALSDDAGGEALRVRIWSK